MAQRLKSTQIQEDPEESHIYLSAMTQNLEFLLGGLSFLLIGTQILILCLIVTARALTAVGLLKKKPKKGTFCGFLRNFC